MASLCKFTKEIPPMRKRGFSNHGWLWVSRSSVPDYRNVYRFLFHGFARTVSPAPEGFGPFPGSARFEGLRARPSAPREAIKASQRELPVALVRWSHDCVRATFRDGRRLAACGGLLKTCPARSAWFFWLVDPANGGFSFWLPLKTNQKEVPQKTETLK